MKNLYGTQNHMAFQLYAWVQKPRINFLCPKQMEKLSHILQQNMFLTETSFLHHLPFGKFAASFSPKVAIMPNLVEIGRL